MIKIDNRFRLTVSCLTPLILLNLVLILPEAFRERIFPFDAALFSANGAFFLSVFKDLPNVISSPVSWMWDYYHQYPALAIKCHPPIFGLVESVMFGMFGISAVTAKLTIYLFSISWIIGWFFALRKMFKDEFTAFLTTLLMLTLPMSVSLGSSVRADIPSMMFFAWGCYFFVRYSESAEKKHKYAIMTALFLSCSLYTYQLPMFGVVALLLYMVTTDWKNLFKRSDFYMGAILFIVLMLPLILFTLRFGSDSLVKPIFGQVNKDLLPFIPVQSKLSMDYWLFYLKVICKHYPIYVAGLILWGLTKIRHRPQKYELFFLLWFLIGYIGFSIIPSKGPRYAYHFVIAALPLTVIGIRDSLKLLTHKWLSEKYSSMCAVAVVIAIASWNVTGISMAKPPYVQGIDKAVHLLFSEEESPSILYHGAFESAFIFYVRKHDDKRNARVLRTANELSDPDALTEDINSYGVEFVVIEGENLRKGAYGGIYDVFWQRIHNLTKNKDKFHHLADIKVRWGKPKQERDVYLNIFKVMR